MTDAEHLPKWSVLESLPYLTAVILEAIRLAQGVATRLPRIAPDEVRTYEGTFQPRFGRPEKVVKFTIPAGTPVSMSTAILHHNEETFPDSQSFIPERWLKDDGVTRRKDLEGYLMSFSKGSRSCLGINLMYCELYYGLAALVLRVFRTMELIETTESDVAYDRDMFIPAPVATSKGVRATMK